MSKVNLSFSVCIFVLFLFFSCTQTEEKTTEQRLYSISFQLIKDFEVLPFSRTKSIPTNKPAEPHAKEEQENASLFSQIEYLVYHKESGSVVKSQVLTEHNSDDFGMYIYDQLEAGTYTIVLFAHSASNLSLLGNEAQFQEMTDAFYATKDVVVGAEDEGDPIEITLKRLVAKVELVGTKSVPANAAKFIVEVEEHYRSILLKNAETTTSGTLKKEYLLAGGINPADAPAYSFYTFVPEPISGDTAYLSGIKLTTLDINEDTLHTIKLRAVPVVKNRVTRYSGSLYTPNTYTGTLALDVGDYGHWRDTINVPI